MNTGKEIRQPMQGFMFALCYFHTLYTRMQKGGTAEIVGGFI